MKFKSIRFPDNFVENTKEFAEKDFRTVPQQIMYWAELGRRIELRNWQLEKMRLGLQQAKSDQLAAELDIKRVFNKCHKKTV